MTLATEILKGLHSSIETPAEYGGVDEETGGEIFVEIHNMQFVEALIAAHQQQYPGSWQEWTVAEKAPEFIAGIKKAIHDKETSPARVLQFCF